MEYITEFTFSISFQLASNAGVFTGARFSSVPLGRDEKRAPLRTPAWEASFQSNLIHNAFTIYVDLLESLHYILNFNTLGYVSTG